MHRLFLVARRYGGLDLGCLTCLLQATRIFRKHMRGRGRGERESERERERESEREREREREVRERE